MSSGIWAGILTVVGIVCGVPLTTFIKGKLDERMEKVKQDGTKNEAAKTEQDKDEEQLRADLVTARQEARVARDDADKERQKRLDDADANLVRSNQIMGAVEQSQANSQRLLVQMGQEREQHAQSMEVQRIEHGKQMDAQRAAHQHDLDEHAKRIEVLEQWISDGKPPPAPVWER